jgi:MFS transporter, AAHS family, 4-hydroxybenzoate transporter
MATAVGVQDLIDNSAFGSFQRLVVAICFATAVVDGIDNQMIGFSSTAIAATLHIPLSAFGAIFSAGTIGGLIGAALLGTLADRIGRKKALLICTILFATLTMATPLARSTSELFALRLVAGLGLGGAMPGFITLVSEYSPTPRRAFAIGLLWCGYPVGGLAGGLIGSQLIPLYGWQAMFFLGGGLAFIAAALQLRMLPESLHYLVRQNGTQERIKRIAERLAPAVDFTNVEFQQARAQPKQNRTGVLDIFSEGRGPSTILLWICMFCTFLITNFFVLWAPALLKSTGFAISTVALMIAFHNFAAIPGQVGSGYLLDRISPFRLLPVGLGISALFTVGLSLWLHETPFVATAIVAIGLLQGGGVAGTLYVVTASYPPAIRSTGVGWATGIGRSGQIVGALLVGNLVGKGVSPNSIFLGMSAPFLIAIGCLLVLGIIYSSRASANLP